MASANPRTLLHSARIPGRALLTGTMCEGGKGCEGEGVFCVPHVGGATCGLLLGSPVGIRLAAREDEKAVVLCLRGGFGLTAGNGRPLAADPVRRLTPP